MSKDTDNIMRFKWLADGCKTWDAVIKRLEERKQEVQNLKKQGYVIESSRDDYLHYYKSSINKNVSEK